VGTAPVLIVHGIWDTAAVMAPLVKGLAKRGIDRMHAIDLPRSGRASIAELGAIVVREAQALAEREKVESIDLVGFSMGALVSRWYVQRGGGKSRVRRFVSISGPHHGTFNARLLPTPAGRDMRPSSDLLRDLAADVDPFGPVDVHCVYTPFDLMILPPVSSVLPGARSTRAFKVVLHGLMIYDRRVHDHIADILRG
jgi:triacylglycerol lipase